MVVEIKDKKIKIPDSDIERTMKVLKISQQEAIKVWLEDEGYIMNEEQEALEKKAKENKITATIHQAESKERVEKKKAQAQKSQQKTQKERTRKDNPTKEMIISRIAEILPEFAENIEILNAGKLISFQIGNDSFEIDLKQKRKKKA